MKRKDKVITILGLSVLLCSVFLVAIPATAIAAGQDDYVLGVYGNANEDDTIDMRDLTYVKLIFFGKKPETELADAKYDGKINPLDFIQIKLIIVGKEKELTLIDVDDRVVTINKPIKRVVTIFPYVPDAMRVLGEKNKIVGICEYTKKRFDYFPEISKLPSIGEYPYDVEAILSLKPDLVVGSTTEILSGKLPDGIPVFSSSCIRPYILVEEMTKIGYIFNKEDKARDYIDNFHDKYIDPIKARTEELPDAEKTKVYVESYFGDYKAYCGLSGANMFIEIAGGKNIFADIPKGSIQVDPEEVVMRNPDIIIKHISPSMGIAGYGVDDPSGMKAKRDEFMNRPELAKVAAVKNGKVYLIYGPIHYGPVIPLGVAYQAKWFRPELFEDLDPQAIHQEYLTRFLGWDYDLDKHGVFVYPPLKD